jgi:hypothetical protein
VHGWLRWHARAREPFPVRERWWVALTAAVVAAAFGLWSVVGWLVTGDPHAYVTSTAAWTRVSGKNPSVLGESWLTHIFSGDLRALVAVLLGLGVLGYCLIRRPARLWAPELRVWSVSYSAFLLVTTWAQSSVVRHLLMVLVPTWPWPEVGDRITDRRRQVLLAVCVGAVGLALQFLWINKFWIDGPYFYSFP